MGHLIAFLLLLLSTGTVSAETVRGRASVVDGDTIEIHGQRIRLYAIDAIEGGQRCTLPGDREWRCGRDAALALADLIGRASVECSVREVDRFGRLVAVCTGRGDDLNAWLVANGWAVAYRRYGLDYADEEDRALRGGLGIWASGFEMHWDWRAARR